MKYSLLTFSVLTFLNLIIWWLVILGGAPGVLNLYFLDIGQGDATFIVLPGGPKILIDGGPDKSVLGEIDKVLKPGDRYVDIVFLTHPQLDHFGGLISVLERYKVGLFIYNGTEGEGGSWDGLVATLNKAGTPVVVLSAGDTLTYMDNNFDILSPNREFLVSSEVNDTTLVAKLNSQGLKSLFTGDIGFAVENNLVEFYDVDADILKVPHHGSKYSSGSKFLAEVSPSVSVIQVGKNRYGHPTEESIYRLRKVGSDIYRNDIDGTIRVTVKNGLLNVFKEK